MMVLLSNGVVKEVVSVEVKPMDVGDGQIVGTEIVFVSANGDKNEYIYNENIPIEETGQRAIDFVNKLYKDGVADFSGEPVEKM